MFLEGYFIFFSPAPISKGEKEMYSDMWLDINVELRMTRSLGG
jgi:hypothetical protein